MQSGKRTTARLCRVILTITYMPLLIKSNIYIMVNDLPGQEKKKIEIGSSLFLMMASGKSTQI